MTTLTLPVRLLSEFLTRSGTPVRSSDDDSDPKRIEVKEIAYPHASWFVTANTGRVFDERESDYDLVSNYCSKPIEQMSFLEYKHNVLNPAMQQMQREAAMRLGLSIDATTHGYQVCRSGLILGVFLGPEGEANAKIFFQALMNKETPNG